MTRNTITDTAVDILDTYGLADMTMRRLAKQLGVAPGALYWHFPSKQALILAVAQAVLAPVLDCAGIGADQPGPPPAGDGCGPTASAGVEQLAHVLRRELLSHRDGAELVLAGMADPALRDSLRRAFALAVGRSVPSAADPDTGGATLVHFFLGAISHEQAQIQLAQATGSPEETIDDIRRTASRRFADGTAIILAGLSATAM
nr:TetR/AcrR family transcriptional regulator [Corynebacterium mendelii]